MPEGEHEAPITAVGGGRVARPAALARVAAERAWVAFRDAECAFQGGPIDQAGTIRPLVVADCRTGLTEARLKDFQGYLSCEEGDTSCPVPPQ